MKTLFTSLLLTCTVFVWAQKVQVTPAPPATATAAPVQPVLTAKAKSLCKEWKLVRTETFDLVQQPTELQKGDVMILMENGRYRLIYEGVAEGGTWTVDKGNVWITLTSDAGTEKKYKILSQSETELKIDYRDADGVHNILIYGPNK